MSKERDMAESMEKARIDEAPNSPKHRGWKAMPYIIGIWISTVRKELTSHICYSYCFIQYIMMKMDLSGNETFEKLGTLGTSSNLLVYMTTVFHLKSATAATVLNVFSGTTNIAALLGAFLSDAYLGRYVTLGFACVSSLLVSLLASIFLGFLIFILLLG